MDRESEEHEENRANREQSENGGESEEESEVDTNLFLRRISEQLTQQREEGNGAAESKFDDLRRIYELNNNNSNSNNNNSSTNNCTSNNNGSSNNSSSNNGHSTHIPEAHRPPSGSASLTSNSPFSAFTTQFPSDRDRLMQFHITNYLNNPNYQQQFGSSSAIPNLPGLTSSIMQPGTSFQSLPGSRIPSPHSQQFQRKQNSSPQPFGRSSPSFQSPPPAHTKRSASVSSRHSREEESSSPVHQVTWSFEEQFKQLYDIDRNDVKRKEFLDDLFSYMQKHETPVTRLPIMAKSVLDLYELYKLVVQRGGLVDVINKKLWQEVIKGLNLPSSITSAAFTLRTQYMKFLYSYECHKLGLSSKLELDAAIEGNKREGRRTSYYGGDLQMRSPTNNSVNNGPHSNNSMHHHGSSRISPVSLVTTSTSNSVSNRIQINGHSNQFSNHVGDAQIPNVSGLVIPGAPVPLPNDPRIMEYFKHIGMARMSNSSMGNGTGSSPDMQDVPNFNNLDLNLALLSSFYNGAVKHPLPQTQMLPFPPQLPRSRSPDSNNDAPLDLGKNRKTDSGSGEELRIPKREHVEDDTSEESESESDEDAELLLPTNSSQVSQNAEIVTPLPIQIKINGIKYRGVLHPKRRKV